jgi:SAM-dependent methyltransferase
MSLLKKLLSHCRKPTGRFGRLLARGMNVGHASLTNWGLSYVEVPENAIALDIGCGGGRTLERLATEARRGKAVGIDYSEASIAVARRKNRQLIHSGRVEVFHSSVSSMPFEDATFDLVTAVETHYFWPDISKDLLEIRRVMKPGGQLVIVCAVYKNARFDRRNLRLVNTIGMTYLSVQEFGEILDAAGYTQSRLSENNRKGWLCAIGVRPAQSAA